MMNACEIHALLRRAARQRRKGGGSTAEILRKASLSRAPVRETIVFRVE